VVETLYDAPFTSVSHEGIDGVFKPDDVGELIAVLKPFLKPEVQPTGLQG
jgi:type I restriction enzyme R subunit